MNNLQEKTRIKIIRIKAKASDIAKERSSKNGNYYISLPVNQLNTNSFDQSHLSKNLNTNNFLIFWKEKFLNLPDSSAFWRRIKDVKKGEVIEAEVSVKTIEGNDGKKVNMITVWNLINIEPDVDLDFADSGYDSGYGNEGDDNGPMSWNF